MLVVVVGGVPLRLLLAPKHVASRFSAALIDARSVSSFWCVSDTATNKGPRCSPPPQFRATPPPADSEGLWFDTRQPTVSLLNV